MNNFRFVDVLLVLFGVFLYPAIVMEICQMDSKHGADLYRDLAFACTNVEVAFTGFLISLSTVYYFHVKREGRVDAGNRIAALLIALIFSISCIIFYLSEYKYLGYVTTSVFATLPFIWSVWFFSVFYKCNGIDYR